jgi:hypothetical protein
LSILGVTISKTGMEESDVIAKQKPTVFSGNSGDSSMHLVTFCEDDSLPSLLRSEYSVGRIYSDKTL